MIRLKYAIARSIGVFLENVDNPKFGLVGLREPTVYFNSNAGSAQQLAAGFWTEVNSITMPGWYRIYFNTNQLGVIGPFGFFVSGTGAYPFPASFWLVKYDEEDLYSLVNGLDLTTETGGLATATDLGTALDALLGDKTTDKSTNPWTQTFKKRDGTSLQVHDYTRSVTTESRVKR